MIVFETLKLFFFFFCLIAVEIVAGSKNQSENASNISHSIIQHVLSNTQGQG